MPMYLKRDAIRLIEASVTAISTAVTSLGLPKRYDYREDAAENAVAIGLAGVAAELSMSAIIVQAHSEKALRHKSGFYKTGTHIVEDFKTLVKSQIPKMMFLTQGVDDPSTHLDKIMQMTSKFKLIVKQRAAGLHAGRGPSTDVAIACVNDVIEFISLLGVSSRIKSYVDTLPKPIIMAKRRELIIDELIQRVAESKVTSERAALIASVYLIIPELPDKEPEWFPAFECSLIAPQERDLSFLLDTLKQSKCGSLIKVSKGKEGIPVVIQKENDNALPIEPQYLKKSFQDIKDQLYADIGTANGRLERKQFDPPPINSVYEFFVVGMTDEEDELRSTADTWPYIAASLSYPGTPGPYWYYVRKTLDVGQIMSYLTRAARVGGPRLQKGVKEFRPYLEKLKKEIPLSRKDKLVSELLSEYEKSDEKRKSIISIAGKYKGKEKELCQDAEDDLKRLVDEEIHVGNILEKIVANTYSFQKEKSREYWARILCECATEIDDLRGLYGVITDDTLSAAHTAARKAFRIIDFVNYGPKVE